MTDAVQTDARKIIQAVLEAQNSLAEYNHHVLHAAGGAQDPRSNPRVRALKVELHTATMMAYQRIRHYVKQNLSNTYWRRDMPTDGDTVDTADSDYEAWMRSLHAGEEAGLFVLDELQAPISKQMTVERERHEGSVEHTTYRAQMMPDRWYQDAIQAIGEAMIQLGLGAEVTPDDGDAGFEYEDILEEGPPDEPELHSNNAAGD